MKHELTITFNVDTTGTVTKDLLIDFLTVLLGGYQKTIGKTESIAISDGVFPTEIKLDGKNVL